jgi:ElaB/YqjD/DUF883 family membrane-anchored ribosome-binding protein
MPPRNPELPEGTDHIINGAMDRGAGSSASAGSGGFVGSGQADDTGGTAGTSKRGNAMTSIKENASSLRDQASGKAREYRDQATGKAREYAVDGKTRAADALNEFSLAVNESAQTIDQRLGAEYGEYARRAADAVSGFSDTLRNKDVDELLDDARALVRKSPVIAIGTAAAVGFALVRLLKSGTGDMQQTGTGTPPDVTHSPTTTAGTGTAATSGTTGSSATTATGTTTTPGTSI